MFPSSIVGYRYTHVVGGARSLAYKLAYNANIQKRIGRLIEAEAISKGHELVPVEEIDRNYSRVRVQQRDVAKRTDIHPKSGCFVGTSKKHPHSAPNAAALPIESPPADSVGKSA